MKSLTHGKNISTVAATNISTHGLRLLSHDKELFLSYEEFTWFNDQPVKAIINVEDNLL